MKINSKVIYRHFLFEPIGQNAKQIAREINLFIRWSREYLSASDIKNHWIVKLGENYDKILNGVNPQMALRGSLTEREKNWFIKDRDQFNKRYEKYYPLGLEINTSVSNEIIDQTQLYIDKLVGKEY